MGRKISVEIVGDASSLERTFGRASRSATHFNRDLSHATRGALAGSGVFRGLGRSIAFASGGFLAFATAGQFLRTSIDAAKGAQVAQAQLGRQIKANGKSYADYREQITKANLKLSEMGGFNNDELNQSLTTILRTTKDVSKALRDNALAVDLARARHISLGQAALVVAKTEAGNTSLLRRQGFQIAKNATVEQALAVVRAKVAGQARAGTTEQERFGAVLHDTEEIIGAGILPTLNQYLAAGATWLTQMNESGKLQRDVADAAKSFHHVISDGVVVVRVAKKAIEDIDRVTGSFVNTLKDLAAVWLVMKARTTLIGWGVIANGLTGVGGAAGAATTKVGLLEAALGRLKLLGPIAIAIGVTEFISFAQNQAKNIATQNGPNFSLKGSKKQYSMGGRGGVFGTGTSPLAPGVAGSPLNPFAPSRFGGGDLGIGGLMPPASAKKEFGAAAAAALSGKGLGSRSPLQGQFNIDELRLADAQRLNNTTLQRQILVHEEAITLKLRDQAKTLKKRTEYAQQAASIEDQIRGLDASKTSAAKNAASKAAKDAGGIPLALQLAQAKADAIAAGQGAQSLTKGQINVAKQIRNAEMRAIRSHKLNMDGLIAAWNEVAAINQQLSGQGKQGISAYHHESTRALVAGLGLANATAVTIRERAAQRDAHHGTAPNGPAAQGQVIHLHNPHFHGVTNIDKLASDLEKVARRKPRVGQR